MTQDGCGFDSASWDFPSDVNMFSLGLLGSLPTVQKHTCEGMRNSKMWMWEVVSRLFLQSLVVRTCDKRTVSSQQTDLTFCATPCALPVVPKHHCAHGEIRLCCCMNFMLVTGWDLNINGALLDSPAAQPTSWSSVYHNLIHGSPKILFISFFSHFF